MSGLAATFAEGWRQDLTSIIGPTAQLSAQLRPDRAEFVADATLISPRGEARIVNARTDLDTFLTGAMQLKIAADETLPPGLRMGATGQAQIAVRRDERVVIEDFAATTAEGGAMSGKAAYDFTTRLFEIAATASASPALVAAILPDVETAQRLSIELSASGAAESFSLRAIAATPALKISGRAIPESRLSLILADLPEKPAGQAAIRTLDGSVRGTANLSRDGGGTWRADRLDWRGAGYSLAGALAFNPASGDAKAALQYQGADNAEPLPGVSVAGDLGASLDYNRSAGNARLDLRATRLVAGDVSIAGLRLEGAGPLSRLPLAIDAARIGIGPSTTIDDVSAALVADVSKDLQATLTRLQGRIDDAPFRLEAPARISAGDAFSIDAFRLSVGNNGSLHLDAVLSPTRWRGTLEAQRLPLTAASALLDARLSLDTDAATPAEGRIALTSLLSAGATDRLDLRTLWNGREIRIEDSGADAALDLQLAAPAPLQRSPRLSVQIPDRIAGAARYAGRLETFAAFLPDALQTLEGDVELNGRIAGPLSAPEINGRLIVRRAAYTELASGLSVVGVEGSAEAAASAQGTAIVFSAKGSGPGQTTKTIAFEGRAALGATSRIDARVTLDGARFSAGPVAAVTASGAVDLAGPFDSPKATGEIRISELDARIVTPEAPAFTPVTVVAVNGAGAIDAPPAPHAPAPALALDIAVRADDRIFVRGRGVDSEWRADMRIVGDAAAPDMLGDVVLRSGSIDFAGRRFELARGVIAFDRLQRNDPALSIRAERSTRGDVLAAISVSGRASAPRVELQSTPALPTEDVMALILFDKPANELTALESLQVAQALAALGGVGLFGGEGVAGRARAALGLDLLSFNLGATDASASSLTIGKYVADGLFISATQDARGENGSLRIEYEIGRSFSIETELRQDGDQRVTGAWKRDF